MEQFIFEFINTVLGENVFFAYLFFFISAVLQLVFPPYPSDVILVFEGYLTTTPSFNFFIILINAIIGSFLGSVIVYKFGYIKGNNVFNYKIIKKFVDDKHKKRAEQIFEKYGIFAIIISKFVPGINAITVLFSGIFRLKKKVVYLSVLFSAIVQHILLLILGRFLGCNMEYVKKILKTYNGIIVGILALAMLIGIFIAVRRKGRRKERV